jgi:Trypsin-co-occurring domain 1
MSGVEGDLARESQGEVLIQVVPESGREIGFGRNRAERLEDRADDVRAGVESAARMVTDSITALPEPDSWSLDEVSAVFGITLTAEAGVLVSKVAAGATVEVTLTYKRDRGDRQV